MSSNRGYDPMQIYNSDEGIRKVVNQLVDGTFSPNDPGLFRDLYNSLLNTQCTQYADTYFILKDFPFLCGCAEADRGVLSG